MAITLVGELATVRRPLHNAEFMAIIYGKVGLDFYLIILSLNLLQELFSHFWVIELASASYDLIIYKAPGPSTPRGPTF